MFCIRDDENDQQTAERILLSSLSNLCNEPDAARAGPCFDWAH